MILIPVTREVGNRVRFSAADVAQAMGTTDDPLILAVLDMVHRQACGAAQLAWLQHPKSREFMETETSRKGWRAYLEDDTAHVIHVLEESGIAQFEEVEI